MAIPHSDIAIPYLTTQQMMEVDRAMIEDYQISLIQMMENAGRSLAHLARSRFLAGEPSGKSVVVLTGSGGNGGFGIYYKTKVCVQSGSRSPAGYSEPNGD